MSRPRGITPAAASSLALQRRPAITELELCRSRAAEARNEADATTLDNVKQRFLRAESAWTAMATRAERVEEQRAARDAEKSAIPLG